MIVTRHAYKRLKERSGLNKKSVTRIAEKAFQEGIRHCEVKGNLKKWMSNVYLRNSNANNLRICGDKLFVFAGDTLITVLQVPSKFANHMDDYLKKSVEEINEKK